MSNQAISGVISTVSSRSFPGRNGGPGVTLYSFQLEDSNRWFRTGETPIPFGKGDAVQFVVDGQNVDVSTMQAQPEKGAETRRGPGAANATASSSATTGSRRVSGASGPSSKDEYWANKEARDLDKEKRFQEVNEPRMAMSVAVQAASQVVVAALQTEALSFGNTAKGKRLGMISDYIKELATDLALFIENAPETLKAAKSKGVGESSVEDDSDV